MKGLQNHVSNQVPEGKESHLQFLLGWFKFGIWIKGKKVLWHQWISKLLTSSPNLPMVLCRDVSGLFPALNCALASLDCTTKTGLSAKLLDDAFCLVHSNSFQRIYTQEAFICQRRK